MFEIKDAYKTLDTINMWINNCDTKASIILSGVGVIATIVLSSDYARIIKNIIEGCFSNFKNNYLLCIFFVIALIMIFIGIMFFISAITPRIIIKSKCFSFIKKKLLKIKNYIIKTKKAQAESIMFYGHIALYDFTDYKKMVNERCDSNNNENAELMNDLIFQIHSASIICNSKFKKIQKGIVCGLVGAILFMICLILSYYKIC